jgi:hypothetical protein
VNGILLAAENMDMLRPIHLIQILFMGKISRFDKRTGQTQNISPEAVRSGKYRFVRTAPVLFNPVDKKTLYYAGNVLF